MKGIEAGIEAGTEAQIDLIEYTKDNHEKMSGMSPEQVVKDGLQLESLLSTAYQEFKEHCGVNQLITNNVPLTIVSLFLPVSRGDSASDKTSHLLSLMIIMAYYIVSNDRDSDLEATKLNLEKLYNIIKDDKCSRKDLIIEFAQAIGAELNLNSTSEEASTSDEEASTSDEEKGENQSEDTTRLLNAKKNN